MNGEEPIATAIGEIVNTGALAGAVTLVWRDGKVVQTACVGWRNVEARLPIARDSLFRIASMTKPITSTAALMLFEEGRFALNDPITQLGTGIFRDARLALAHKSARLDRPGRATDHLRGSADPPVWSNLRFLSSWPPCAGLCSGAGW